MTTYFISWHQGALDWAKRHRVKFDFHKPHLLINEITAQDIVIGSFPVNLAAQVCDRGARYLHLSLELPPEIRGKALSVKQLDQCLAKLEEYRVQRIT